MDHVVATCNATNKDFIVSSFSNKQSFYRELFSAENQAKLELGLQGDFRKLEDLDGMLYSDRKGLVDHLSTMLYCVLVFRDSPVITDELYKKTLKALHLPDAWRMGDAMEGLDFLERVDQHVLPPIYVLTNTTPR